MEAVTIETVLCPYDGECLNQGASIARCAVCGREYRSEAGVLRLLAEADQFYEGAYLSQVRYIPRSERWYHAWPLWLLNGGFVWQVRRWIPAGSRILELGCGGGIAYFGRRYRMTGIDLSFASLSIASRLYERVIQADAAAGLPLPSQSVDAVISACFWEHMTPANKVSILAECRRVLKPGGRVVFLYDVATRHPWIRRSAALLPALYRESFLENDGHVGYETVEQNRSLMENQGFRVVAEYGLETTMLSGSALEKLQRWPGVAGALASLVARIARGPFFHVYNAAVRAVDDTVGRIAPIAWSRMVIHVLTFPAF